MSKSGYVDCGCRDCFEIAIGQRGAFCAGCKEHGCEPNKECRQPDAYESTGTADEPEDSQFGIPECGE